MIPHRKDTCNSRASAEVKLGAVHSTQRHTRFRFRFRIRSINSAEPKQPTALHVSENQ